MAKQRAIGETPVRLSNHWIQVMSRMTHALFFEIFPIRVRDLAQSETARLPCRDCRLVHDFLGMYLPHPKATELSPSGTCFPG
jgi:hypothetical protein